MGIVDEDVAAVRAASDIVAIVGQYTQLRKVGRRFQGRCPFHDERTPSFSVNAEDGLYYCFGCQAKGDVFTFVQEMEHVDFPTAVEHLAAKLGRTLHYTDRNEAEGRKRRARLIETMARAVEWYHERLVSGADAGVARKYLRERGFDGEVVREFQIGWAPDAWDELCKALRLDRRTAEETGLGRLNRRGRLQDHFRGRIMFPIFDDQGRPISFGGRILPGGERPGNEGKYQNTAETPLYNKSKVLYGLDRAKRSMVTADTAVVCEGYTDVIGFHRSGVPLAVAACGTALTEDHVRLLRRFAARFVLAFDADSAGQAAAERFYRWERDHDLEVMVADLPAGQDPADLARTDPDRLQAAVSAARPFLRFRLDRVFAAADLSTPEGRARAAEAALDVVAEHPDLFVRDQYLMDVGSRCRVEPERLRAQVERLRSRPRVAHVRRQDRGPASGRPDRPSGAAGSRGARRGRGPTQGGAPHEQARDPGRAVPNEPPPPGGPVRDSGRPVPNEPPPPGGPIRDRGRAVPDEPPTPRDLRRAVDLGAERRRGADGAPAGRGGSVGRSGGGPPAGADPVGEGGGGPGDRDVPGSPDRSGRPDRSQYGTDHRGFDADGAGAGDAAGQRGGRGRSGGPGPRLSTVGPALEVLRHAVHDPAAVAPWLDDVLFDDPVHAGVYRALVEFDTHADAVASAAPPVADLLARLAVEEPTGAPLDGLRRLFTEVARRELRLRRLTSMTSEDPAVALAEASFLVGAINDLRDPSATTDVADRLLAWLRQRVGDGG